ncbi:MAG: TPM domain-containing protein [Bacteroidota bacterium]
MRGRARPLTASGTVVLLALAVVSTASGQDVPALTGRVVDRADLLSASAEVALVETLAAHEDSTGNQVVVLTIRSLEGEVLEPYATRVFRAWDLGQEDDDNGVLLLVAVAERQVRIEVGYGLEGSLTDAAAGSIIRREIVPEFKAGNFEAGILAGASSILGTIEGTYEPPRGGSITINGRPAEDVSWVERLVFALFFGGLPLGLVAFPLLRYGYGISGRGGDVAAGCSGLFVGPFVGGGLLMLFVNPWMLLVGVVAMPVLLIALNRALERHPRVGKWRRHNRRKAKAFAAARLRGATTVVVDGTSYSVPSRSSGGGSSGGFSGGGGSSGGGGASGSW